MKHGNKLTRASKAKNETSTPATLLVRISHRAYRYLLDRQAKSFDESGRRSTLGELIDDVLFGGMRT